MSNEEGNALSLSIVYSIYYSMKYEISGGPKIGYLVIHKQYRAFGLGTSRENDPSNLYTLYLSTRHV
jgi:hypothetical protein